MSSLVEIEKWLLTLRESHSLEFKEAKRQYDYHKLLGYCVALANEGGGKFILGVTDKPPRLVVGSNAFQNLQEVETRLFDKLHFRVDAEEFIHPDGRILIFHVPSRPRGTAFHLDGAYLMRSGDQLVPMSEDRLRAIFAEGAPNWLVQSALQNASEQVM